MRKKIQLGLLAVIVITGIRAAYIIHERRVEQETPVKQEAPPLNPDYYVTPRKLHPYDLKSARDLTQQPVWAKVGYSYTYYPVSGKHVDFAHPVGLLLPLEKMTVKDVIAAVAPTAPDQRQLMAVFEKDGHSYAFSIGTVQNENYQIYSDDMLFIQDPHELYKHWPSDVWQSIDKHEAKPGMSELQMGFALGLGIPQGSGDVGERVLEYANGGKPLRIVDLCVQPVEPVGRDLAVTVDPLRRARQRFPLQPARPPLGVPPPADQARPLEHLQCFDTACRLISNGAASSFTVASPSASRASTCPVTGQGRSLVRPSAPWPG